MPIMSIYNARNAQQFKLVFEDGSDDLFFFDRLITLVEQELIGKASTVYYAKEYDTAVNHAVWEVYPLDTIPCRVYTTGVLGGRVKKADPRGTRKYQSR
jgi:hypothetical protein